MSPLGLAIRPARSHLWPAAARGGGPRARSVGDAVLLQTVGTQDGVTEQHFEFSVNDQTVPGLLWVPCICTKAKPVVVVGHGHTSHKCNNHIVQLAQLLVGSS